jgi:hypothetical protein
MTMPAPNTGWQMMEYSSSHPGCCAACHQDTTVGQMPLWAPWFMDPPWHTAWLCYPCYQRGYARQQRWLRWWPTLALARWVNQLAHLAMGPPYDFEVRWHPEQPWTWYERLRADVKHYWMIYGLRLNDQLVQIPVPPVQWFA